MEDFLKIDQESEETVTPETLAWKLLMENDVEKFAGVIQSFVDEADETDDVDQLYNSLSGQFEILITMYMEMVFNMLRINHITSQLTPDGTLDESIDLEASFSPDLSQFTVDDMLVVFRDKFAKIRVFLSVLKIHSTTDNPRDFGEDTDYYCRILLKDTLEGKQYYWNNREKIDPTKRYTFLLRDDKETKQKKLSDFFAVCSLPQFKLKISFSPINVIASNPHTAY